MPIWGWIIIAVVGLLIIMTIGIYNGLIKLRVRVDEAWSDITVQLKRRADLIPNLIETVKGYAKHEKGVFEEVTKARAAIMSAAKEGPAAAAKAENQFEGALKSLFAVAENYPDLKANQNFMQLQGEITDTEDKIQASRRFYNGGVRDLNTKIQTFPSNIFASIFGFKQREFFEVEDRAAIEEAPKVSF
ncbi:LemA family protein [Candidatus Saccharibacteria bacterium]|nr:LemA family protein [Candidatus Saccharibacteria bacterium]